MTIVENKENNLDNQVVKAYAQTILLIDEIIRAVDMETANSMPNNSLPIYQKVEEVRLGDICKKMKAAVFAEDILASDRFIQLEKLVKEKGFELVVYADFSRKSAILDVRVVKDYRNNEREVLLGVQIQGEQYRKYAQRRIKGRNKDNLVAVFQEFVRYDWFENYEPQSKQIFGESTSMSKLFNSY